MNSDMNYFYFILTKQGVNKSVSRSLTIFSSATDCVVPESFEHGSIKSPIRPGDTVVIKCDTG